MQKGILFVFSILSFVVASAQSDTTKLVKHSAMFRFKEGIYLNHTMMAENSPIPKSHLITKYNPSDFDFFSKLLMDEKVDFYDSNGIKKSIEVNKLYGFCRKGALFINYGSDFCRIPVVGTVCHFVANITIYEDRYNNPNMYGYGGYYSVPTTTTKTEVKQYLYHFKTGQVLDYTYENIELILKSDKELYEEFEKLRKKKKKQLKFVYLRKFNEKHPLFIPVN
jgi:hypothetical protein